MSNAMGAPASLTVHQEPGLALGLANVTAVGVTVCPLQGADGEPQGQALLAGCVLPRSWQLHEALAPGHSGCLVFSFAHEHSCALLLCL
jgi:hypothetical protein